MVKLVKNKFDFHHKQGILYITNIQIKKLPNIDDESWSIVLSVLSWESELLF